MTSKLLPLRRPDTCISCEDDLPVGTKAWWDPAARTVTCQSCKSTSNAAASGRPARVRTEEGLDAFNDIGIAGASAENEYQKRHTQREKRIEDKWGRFAGAIKFLSDDPQSITAWKKGSEGERMLAGILVQRLGERIVLLNDRRVPGSRANIDHLVIASSGVWVIDAKNYRGIVEQRDRGGWFKTDLRLYVGGRDRTKLASGLSWQIETVRTALDEMEVPVTGVLCFTDAEWRFFAKPFTQDEVWVTWPRNLIEMIDAPGPLSLEEVRATSNLLATSLPSHN